MHYVIKSQALAGQMESVSKEERKVKWAIGWRLKETVHSFLTYGDSPSSHLAPPPKPGLHFAI